jgi:hypothetical protein
MADAGRRWISLAVVVFCALGCGPSGPPLFKVTGEVTFDGRPVEDGEILFIAADKESGPEVGWIKNGAYELHARVGKKRVEIRASRAVPGKVNPMGAVYADYIPRRYNAETTLEAEVRAEGANRFDYGLRSGRE